jgi:hypothetical protein
MVSFKINRPAAPTRGAPSRSPRRRVLIEGQFQTLTATYPVAVRNLSCTGALIESKVGGQGVIATPHLDCFCRVIWNRGTLYGLSFDQPLHQSVVLHIHSITQSDVQEAKIADAKQWWGPAR